MVRRLSSPWAVPEIARSCVLSQGVIMSVVRFTRKELPPRQLGERSHLGWNSLRDSSEGVHTQTLITSDTTPQQDAAGVWVSRPPAWHSPTRPHGRTPCRAHWRSLTRPHGQTWRTLAQPPRPHGETWRTVAQPPRPHGQTSDTPPEQP